MKILSAEVHNFGSYQHLQFRFDALGLTLVQGTTGAGKSTLLDIVPWILFGTTAKNGAVDDVRGWQTDGESTTGCLSVRTRSGEISVHRTRGTARDNDLYWKDKDSDEKHRGKDLNDTQIMLEQKLGISAELFIQASYLHEFAPVGSFFTASAKARRELLEGIASLQFPARIIQSAAAERKSISTLREQLGQSFSSRQGALAQSRLSTDRLSGAVGAFDHSQVQKIKEYEARQKSFEEEKTQTLQKLSRTEAIWAVDKSHQIETLLARLSILESKIRSPKDLDIEEARLRNSLRCNSCGALPENINEALRGQLELKFNNNKYISDLKQAKQDLKRTDAEKSPYLPQIAQWEARKNDYAALIEQERAAVNPFVTQVAALEAERYVLEKALEVDKAEIAALDRRKAALEHIQDLAAIVRAELLRKAVRELESKTNEYLEKYFEGALRVEFSAESADNIAVDIRKSGYQCNYKQLSRGQRAMLRLSFGVSVMQASANQAGQHMNVLMFDEVLDGLDVELKVKAAALFEELSLYHETVILVDHCTELQAQVANKYTVSMVGDFSEISEC